MKRKLRKHLFQIIFALLGAGAGFAYYRLVGCATGACPIAANPYLSILLGALLGVSLASLRNREGRNDA